VLDAPKVALVAEMEAVNNAIKDLNSLKIQTKWFAKNLAKAHACNVMKTYVRFVQQDSNLRMTNAK